MCPHTTLLGGSLKRVRRRRDCNSAIYMCSHTASVVNMCPHTTLLWWQLEAWEKEAQLYAKYFANLNPVLDGGVGGNFFFPPHFPPLTIVLSLG